MKRLLSTSYTDTSFNIAALVLRVIGSILIFFDHGLPHLTNFSSLQSKFFDPFHIGHRWSLLLLIFAEVFCAIFVALGLFTRFAAIPIVIAMATAAFIFHKGQPLKNWEPALTFLTIFVAILFIGPGRYSVDAAMGK